MKYLVLLMLLSSTLCTAQPRLEMPMLAAPLPRAKFELINKIPAESLARLPKGLPSYKWSSQPRNFSTRALQSLLDESAFAGTNITSLLSSSKNQDGSIRLASRDNRDVFFVLPSAGRIAIQNTDRNKDYPPPDAVPDFAAVSQRALHYAELFGVSTSEMERKPDGAIHFRKTENTTSHLGGSVKYKSKRSVTMFRSINGYIVRSLDEDKIELELGINGRLLKFNFKWPNIEAVRTNEVLGVSQIMDNIKKGNVLADISNEYPKDGITEITLKDYQVFYYVSTMFAYGKRVVTTPNPDIQPMIEFLATFKSGKGNETEGSLFAPITQSP